MPPKFAAKAKANHGTLAGLRAAIAAPPPAKAGAVVANPKGLAKAKDVQAANDGFLRVLASATDTGVLAMINLPAEVVPVTDLIFGPFRGAAWNTPPAAGSCMGRN